MFPFFTLHTESISARLAKENISFDDQNEIKCFMNKTTKSRNMISKVASQRDGDSM